MKLMQKFWPWVKILAYTFSTLFITHTCSKSSNINLNISIESQNINSCPFLICSIRLLNFQFESCKKSTGKDVALTNNCSQIKVLPSHWSYIFKFNYFQGMYKHCLRYTAERPNFNSLVLRLPSQKTDKKFHDTNQPRLCYSESERKNSLVTNIRRPGTGLQRFDLEECLSYQLEPEKDTKAEKNIVIDCLNFSNFKNKFPLIWATGWEMWRIWNGKSLRINAKRWLLIWGRSNFG